MGSSYSLIDHMSGFETDPRKILVDIMVYTELRGKLLVKSTKI